MKKLMTIVVSALCAAVSCVSFADQISVTPSDFAAKVAAANDGDVFVFSAGTYGLSEEIAVSRKTGLSFVGATDGETVITRTEGADIRFFNIDGHSRTDIMWPLQLRRRRWAARCSSPTARR